MTWRFGQRTLARNDPVSITFTGPAGTAGTQVVVELTSIPGATSGDVLTFDPMLTYG